MKTIEATFRIVTPMFLGGADHSVTDGIRAPSVKGALRFWWRALNWRRLYEPDTAKALAALHAEEARLFGAAAKTIDKEQAGGQGVFLLNVRHDELTSKKAGYIHEKFRSNDAARYLGYGLMVAFGSNNQMPPTTSGQLQRDCIDEGQEFVVSLLFRGEIVQSVRDALIFMGLVGGLGSRARHGMGSIALIRFVEPNDTPNEWQAPLSAQEYDVQINQLFSRAADVEPSSGNTEPPFSAFWQESRIDRLLCGSSCFAALDDFARALLMYRSWGRSDAQGGSKVLGKASERRFDNDHKWFKDKPWARSHPGFHPRRVVFGLPHNYHKDHHHVVSENYERRSSPLLFHVHPIAHTFIGVGIFMPAKFLPTGERISANGEFPAANIDWSVITDFLDGKIGNPATTINRFSGKTAVLP